MGLYTSSQPGRQYKACILKYWVTWERGATVKKNVYWYTDLELAKRFALGMVGNKMAFFASVTDMQQGKRGKVVFSAGQKKI